MSAIQFEVMEREKGEQSERNTERGGRKERRSGGERREGLTEEVLF